MAEKLTLKHIAQAANVSEMTASRALRDASEVSKATRERVLRVAAEMGYVRNKIAGALASNKVDLVGVIIPSVKSYVFSEVLDGISHALAPTKLRPVFGLTNYDLTMEEDVIGEMLSWRPSGLIIAGLEHSDRAKKMLRNADIPIVEVMDVDGEPINYCIGVSHHQAGLEMAETFVARGYKNIGFIGTKMDTDYRAQKRLAGFTEGLQRHGLSLVDQELYMDGSSFAKGKERTERLLQRSPDIDAIYYSTDITSVGGLMYCLEKGLSVPGDLALAGFNGLGLLDGMPTALATTDSLRYDIGQQAAQLINALNEGDEVAADAITVLPTKPLINQSL